MPQERKETGFLERGVTPDCNLPISSQELLNDTLSLDEICLPMRPIATGQKISISIMLEELKIQQVTMVHALVDSRCTRTCIDEEYIQSLGWPLLKIKNPIRVEYADGTVTEKSTIRYSIDIWIRVAGLVIVTGVLVMRLKTFKVFLGFDWLQVVNPAIDWQKREVKVDEVQIPLQMRTLANETPNYPEEFEQVFSEEGFKGLPPRRRWDHVIQLKEGHTPPRGRCYPLAARKKEALKEFIGTNLHDGKIRTGDSPYMSLFFFRPKPGGMELCGIQDYKKLNEITVKDQYPLPLISDILRRVQGSCIFTKMDLWWGFNNVRIHKGDEKKVTFITPLGLFKPAVMQFGLCNMPSTFQQIVDDILTKEKSSGFIEVYVDDILVHSETREENWYWVRQVLHKLEEHHLFCRKEKCQFEVEEVEFLGVVLARGGVRVSDTKTCAIWEETLPRTWKGLWCFLGLTNYHRRFLEGYSAMVRPLHDLTKDIPYEWMVSCQEAFNRLKDALVTAPILALPLDKGKFRLEMDALDVATGAVLLQQQEDGMFRPVGYSSKSYNQAEQNYMTYDKEMLGVMRGLEEWWSLLIGAAETFKILTDHQNFTYFREPQKLTTRQVNWTTKLQDYDFVIKHVSGTSNMWADALSQLDRMECVEKKVDTLLLERYFVRLLSGRCLEEDPMEEYKVEILKRYHDALTAGHPRVKQTLDLPFRRKEKWPGIWQDVKRYIKGCLVCQKTKSRVGPESGSLLPMPMAGASWEVISWDLIRPLPESRMFDAIVTMVDTRSKAIKLELANVTIMSWVPRASRAQKIIFSFSCN
jgi:hypothetical protein